MPSKPASTPNPSSSPPKNSPTSSTSSTNTTNHHNPTTPEARALVDDLIYGEWLKRRLRAAETQIWAYDHQENYRPDPKYPLGQTAAGRGKAFAQLQWRIECTRRASRQALQDLQQLQHEPPRESSNRRRTAALRNPHTRNRFTRNWLRSSHPAARGPRTAIRCPQDPGSAPNVPVLPTPNAG